MAEQHPPPNASDATNTGPIVRRLRLVVAAAVPLLLAANALVLGTYAPSVPDLALDRASAPTRREASSTSIAGADAAPGAPAGQPAPAPSDVGTAPTSPPSTATTVGADPAAAPTAPPPAPTTSDPTRPAPPRSNPTPPPPPPAAPAPSNPTPPGSVPPPPTTGASPIAHGPGRVAVATTTFGPKVEIVPKTWLSANLDRNAPEKAAGMVRNITAEARQRKNADNVVVTVPLAWHLFSAKKDAEGSLRAMQDVADGKYDDVYRGIATALVEGGYPNGVIRFGHEHNMKWTPWYSGGGRAPVFVAAWRRAADVVRQTAPRVALDWNIGAAGADPDDQNGDGSFDPNVWPGDNYVDVVGRDIYCRSAGRSLANVQKELDEHARFAASHGKPVSYPEVGVTLPNPDETPHSSAGDDATCARFINLVLGYADRADTAYVVWWGADRKDQGYRYRVTPDDTQCWAALEKFYR